MHMLAQAATSGWSIPGWASVIGILLVVVATVAAAVAVARVSYNEARIKGLLGDIADRDGRMKIMKDDLTDLKTKYEAVKIELESEKDKVAVLQTLVTGKEQLDHMQQTIDQISSQLLDDHREIKAKQVAILRKLGALERKLEEDAA